MFRARYQVSEALANVGGKPRPYRHFSDCDSARAAGYGSLRSGEPSYRPELDRDGDGVACEPFSGGRRRFWRGG